MRYQGRTCPVLDITKRRCDKPAHGYARGLWYCESHARQVYLGLVEGDRYLSPDGLGERYRRAAFMAAAWMTLTRRRRVPRHMRWLLPRSPVGR